MTSVTVEAPLYFPNGRKTYHTRRCLAFKLTAQEAAPLTDTTGYRHCGFCANVTKPGKEIYASAGSGSAYHFNEECWRKRSPRARSRTKTLHHAKLKGLKPCRLCAVS